MELKALHIPRVLRGFDAGADQVFDLRLQDGRIASIRPSAEAARGLLLSAPVEAHAHIDKNYTVEETGGAQGDLFSAIRRMEVHRASWNGATLQPRMERALQEAWRFGTRALRTHLDWGRPEAPASLAVLEALRDAWRGRIELQFVALTPLDVYADEDAGARIAREVQRAQGVLGAFVYRNADLAPKLRRVFALAVQHGLRLDFHVDEGLDVEARGLRQIAELTLEHGLQGRVVCGHACSLSVQPDDEALETLALCARAGLHLIALPSTNLYLQGAWDRTPVQRGLTRLHEARAAGLGLSLATDNVQDAFYPYGGYDLLDTFALGVQAAHLAPALDWIDTVTMGPAQALGLDWDGRLHEGAPADLLWLQARHEYELIGPRGRARRVIRAGRLLEEMHP
ncbi:amidohydrolase family protein [Xenophilus sp. Marseille-Q4582]|uniref:amidohydrolase family protein n=1 Tax=Xenophilus sp. Marseille-Q4582 TaxID=2866600 RepID=UPI001CE3D26B|nr:amidohydrolase family protein [Xenophilus sp. Marseille-Q4582]